MLIHYEVRLVEEYLKKKEINFIKDDWKYEPIIQWSSLAKNMPWGALILLGAGLTVASAFQVC